MTLIKRFANDRSGAVMVYIAVMTPILAGLAGLAVDTGMWYAQSLARFAFVAGERLDTAGDLSAFFAGSRYFSDGHRLVLWLSAEPVSLLEARNLDWDELPARDHQVLAR